MGQEGFVEVEGGRVWYEILGDANATPLILLHGGPGSSHISQVPVAEALKRERSVVLYDQLGCGNSDRPDDTSLWTRARFVRELATLRASLGLSRVHILGHSWGTMLLADYLLSKPEGVVSAIFSSPCLSAARWVADADVLRLALPEDVQSVLTTCEKNGTTDSDAYRAAEKVYMQRHVCRVEPTPEARAQQQAAFGAAVYNYMWGPSEFCATGTLRNYDQTARLHEIAVPSLFTCGEFDEASPASTAYYHSLVPGSRFHTFANSSHSPQVESPDEYFSVIRAFMQSVE